MARHKVHKRTTTTTRGSLVIDYLGAEDLAASPVESYGLVVSAGATAVEWRLGGGGVSSVTGTAPIASSGGTTPVISLNDDGVTNAKLANMAVDTIKGRATAGTGDPEDIACTAAGRALLDDIDAAAQRATLGLGTLATQSGTFSGTSSGTNTGDQTSVSGNAGTATALQTPRNINGVAFNGTADITVTAAGSTLTGTSIAAGMLGTSATTACAGNDARLSDARTPTAHAASHANAAGDPIKLDDLATPDDNTDLDASAVRHGLMKKYPGGTATFLRADGAFAAPVASVVIKQTEIDFGSTAVDGAAFVVVDTDVSAGSKIIGTVAYVAATGRDLDELQTDGLDIKFAPGAGQLTIYARSLAPSTRVYGKWKINYLVG